MPLYLCNSKYRSIPQEAKAKIAKDVTDIHCENTGAPREFVHVFFFEDAPAPQLEGRIAKLQGNIRAGRNAEQKAAISNQMRQSISAHSGLAISDVGMEITDVPASWVVEGGEVFPEPGEEAAWLEEHAKRLAAEQAQ